MLQLTLDDALLEHLPQGLQTSEAEVREFIVCEMFRRNLISRGRAAALLGIEYLDFCEIMRQQGIPWIDLSPDEWEQEKQTWERIRSPASLSPMPQS